MDGLVPGLFLVVAEGYCLCAAEAFVVLAFVVLAFVVVLAARVRMALSYETQS